MSEGSQIDVPPSFVALFLEPGRNKLLAPRLFIAERYELCEDMAQLLTATADSMLHALGIAESDVLQRCHQGLCAEGSAFEPDEATWVVRRLAELMGWDPAGAAPA